MGCWWIYGDRQPIGKSLHDIQHRFMCRGICLGRSSWHHGQSFHSFHRNRSRLTIQQVEDGHSLGLCKSRAFFYLSNHTGYILCDINYDCIQRLWDRMQYFHWYNDLFRISSTGMWQWPCNSRISLKVIQNRHFLLALLSIFRPLGVVICSGIAYSFIPQHSCSIDLFVTISL